MKMWMDGGGDMERMDDGDMECGCGCANLGDGLLKCSKEKRE
jgi:hypothetical protein